MILINQYIIPMIIDFKNFINESIEDRFKIFENKNFQIGDRFGCIHPIAFFKVGDIGTLSKVEKFNIDGYNIDAYTLINKYGIGAPLLLNVLEEAFIKIKPLKQTFSKEDPFGEEEWEDPFSVFDSFN